MKNCSGSVYLAAQEANPFGSLIALYVVAENEKLGVRVKLAGEGHLDEGTGQVSTTFQNTPQVPFEELDVKLFGGQRGLALNAALLRLLHEHGLLRAVVGRTGLDRRARAGELRSRRPSRSAPASAALPARPARWRSRPPSRPASTQPAGRRLHRLSAERSRTRTQTSRCRRSRCTCPAAWPRCSPRVTPCPEAQAAATSCGPDSLIGHSTAIAGLGSEPFSLPRQRLPDRPLRRRPLRPLGRHAGRSRARSTSAM